MNNVVKLKQKQRMALLECSSCGAGGEGTCDCGAPYVAAGARAAAATAKNPGMSNRAIAAELGVSYETVRRARTIDTDVSPRVGLDGKKRRMPSRISKPKPNHEMPTEEEAEEDYQTALYDQACMLLEQMACATRQRFFATMKRKYQK